ncbi:unnamed protein product [Notodromas monacha]|uniref:Magnesium-dependent phosphatase 1 n=1 Tax=Notodromas monacha TaxID=399045 RepID=A0A7R9BXS7_9CRUS|nr:unnamed protein product [Notodromas monacha]CAG0922588.1 unnamed protein product [Notodromas monacha]
MGDTAFAESPRRPGMVVFDLDYTLWQFYADCVSAPFVVQEKGDFPVIKSVDGQRLKPFPDSVKILKKLKEEGYLIGVASRSPTPSVAWKAIDAFEWRKFFDHSVITPGCKRHHIKELSKESGVSPKEMIFFDDEHRNIRDLEDVVGVCCLVDGVSFEEVRKGFRKFAALNS